jgi:hypothetical protein
MLNMSLIEIILKRRTKRMKKLEELLNNNLVKVTVDADLQDGKDSKKVDTTCVAAIVVSAKLGEDEKKGVALNTTVTGAFTMEVCVALIEGLQHAEEDLMHSILTHGGLPIITKAGKSKIPDDTAEVLKILRGDR